MRFLTDVDEVLADFIKPACKVVSHVLGRPWGLDDAPKDSWDIFGNLTEDEREVVFTIIHAPGWCANLKPHDGAKEFVAELQELLDGEVYACTTHNHAPYWVYEREIWLADEMGIGPLHVAQTRAKYLCGGDWLLDDGPQNVIPWQQEHPDGVGLLWTTEHNTRLKGYDEIRAHSFDEVIERVKKRL